jgi:hypothetical protein
MSFETFISIEAGIVASNIADQNAKRTRDFALFRKTTKRIKSKLATLTDSASVTQLQDELETFEEIRFIATEWMYKCESVNENMLKRLQDKQEQFPKDGAVVEQKTSKKYWGFWLVLVRFFRNRY